MNKTNSNPNPKAPTIDANGNRLYYYLGVYVSSDGKTIYKLDPSTGSKQYYTIKQKPNGAPYIEDNGNTFFVNYLVAVCYKPAPKDGKKYVIAHLDGNVSNCDVNNLEWRLPQPSPVIQKPHKPYTLNTYSECKFGSITINKNGEVYDGKNLLNQNDDSYDCDTDLFVCGRPFVIVNGKRHYMDDLVTNARFVEGTPDNKKHPVILHKDHDRNNYASNNLEWVEEDSPEYIEYLKDENAQKRKRNVELNPGKAFPDFMQPKP